MFNSPRISTTYGARLASQPPGFQIPDDPAQANALADRMDRMADEAAAEGNFALADKLTVGSISARSGAGARA